MGGGAAGQIQPAGQHYGAFPPTLLIQNKPAEHLLAVNGMRSSIFGAIEAARQWHHRHHHHHQSPAVRKAAARFRVQGFRVWGLGFGVLGLGFTVLFTGFFHLACVRLLQKADWAGLSQQHCSASETTVAISRHENNLHLPKTLNPKP